MTRNLVTVAILLAVVSGCSSSDGGPVGTGISGASISGNVVAVDGAEVAGVAVSIEEVSGLQATTDAEGNFELSGDFAGPITLRFDARGISSSGRFDVPQQARLVLHDISVRRDRIEVDTVRLIDFRGAIRLIDCDDGTLLIDDRRGVANQFLVRLSEDTAISRGDAVLACADLEIGQTVAVEGAVQPADRTIVAVSVAVNPGRPGDGSAVVEVRFHGRVRVVACPARMIQLEDALLGRTRLRLTEATRIFDASQRAIACSGIAVGDIISGRGGLDTRRPNAIEALQLNVMPPAG
ncbi:MAG TPA: carboxypeptidase regulatory-like domain-containing protein [Terriglobales bacterium]|nr:carboxypeptidase regulatory-like domain-containing protein [Terriglobales bacterium]